MVNLLLTSRCNKSCDYCFLQGWMKENQDRIESFSLNDLKKVIRWLENTAPPGERQVRLTGGEPLLHPHIERIIELLVDSDIFIQSIMTNGIVDSKILSKIKKHSPGTHFLINVNHPDSYTDKQWEKINQNLKLLAPETGVKEVSDKNIKRYKRLKLSITFYHPDQSYQYILDLARKYNSHCIRYSPSMPSNKFENSHVDFNQLRKLKPTLVSFVKDAISEYIDVNLDCVFPPCIFDIGEWRLLNNLTGGVTSVCNSRMYITPDLKVVYCGALRGNLESIHIKEMPFGEMFNEIDNRAEMIRNFELSRCRDCEFSQNKLCQGYCLGYKVEKMRKKNMWP